MNLYVALAILYITSKSHENKLLLLLSTCPFNLKKVVKRPSFVKRLAYPPHAGVLGEAYFAPCVGGYKKVLMYRFGGARHTMSVLFATFIIQESSTCFTLRLLSASLGYWSISCCCFRFAR